MSKDRAGKERRPGNAACSVKAALCGMLGIAGSALVSVQAGVNLEAMQDAYHVAANDQTPTERRLSGAVSRALGKKVSLRCSSQNITPSLVLQDSLGETPQLFWFHNLPYLRVDQQVCQDAARVSEAASFRSSEELHAAALGVLVVTHEGAHYAYNDGNEGVTDCRALQRTERVARNLGASPEIAGQLQNALVTDFTSFTDSSEYQPPAVCYDGGPYDLDPAATNPNRFLHSRPA